MVELFFDKFEFHPNALCEYKHALRYYEDQQTGLSERFVFDLANAFRRILAFPESSPVFENMDDIRRCATRVFPFSVIYLHDQDSIKIVAIAHQHQEPDYWLKRIG